MLSTSRRPVLTSRIPSGGRFNTRWRQLLLSEMRRRNADRAINGDNTGRSSPVPSSYLGDAAVPPSLIPALEPGVDIPGRPIDPGSIVGPPLRSGYIQGQPRPLLPGAPSAYPVVVPEPRRLHPVLNLGFTSGTFSLGGISGAVYALNNSILQSPISAPGYRTTDNTRCLGFRIRANAYHLAAAVAPTYALHFTFLLVYDKQPEAAVPPATDMFDPDPSSGNVNSNSAQTFGTRDRYRILWQRSGTLTPGSPPSGVPSTDPNNYAFIQSTVNCNLPVNYGRIPGGSGPGQMSLGSIYFVALGPPRPSSSYSWKTIVCRFDCDYLYRDQ